MKNPGYLSVLTVLRNFFGDQPSREQIQRLGKVEIQTLRQLVLQYSDAHEPTNALREAIYPGSWLAGNWQLPAIRGELHQSILYHEAIVTHDPLADYFGIQERWLPELRPIRSADGSMIVSSGPQLWNAELNFEAMKNDLDRVRGFLGTLIPYLFELAPLLDEGIIRPRPQWKVLKERKEALLASVRHDTKNDAMVTGAPRISENIGPLPMWDNLKGFHLEMEQPILSSDQHWEWQYEFFQLAKQIAFADRYRTIYIPHSAAELEFLKIKLQQLDQRQETNPRPATLSEIARFVLPNLALPVSTAISIRRNEESFTEWQETIRSIDRESAGDTPNQLNQRIEDRLAPIYRDIHKFSRRESLKRLSTKEGLSIVLTASGALMGAAAIGASPVEATVPGASGGVLGWLGSMFMRPKLGGTARILSSLQKETNGASK